MVASSFNNPIEKLYRAVRPKELYWESENRVTSAVFDLRSHDKGVSFDRADGRTDKECCEFMHNQLDGKIISLTVNQCLCFKEVNLIHSPSSNPYHSELLYLTFDKHKLKQIKHQLAVCAKVEAY